MEITQRMADQTVSLEQELDRLNRGDATVRGELIQLAGRQLRLLTAELRRELGPLDTGHALRRPIEELYAEAETRLYMGPP